MNRFIASPRLERTGYYVRRGPSSGTQGHSHLGLEIFVVHAGLTHFQIGNWSRVLASGSVVLIDAATLHRGSIIKGPYLRTALHFLPDRVQSGEHTPLQREIENQGGVIFSALDAERAKRFAWISDQLIRQELSSQIVSHLIGVILCDIKEAQTDADTTNNTAFVHNLIAHMDAHADSPIDISNLASKFFLSETHLRMLFKKYVGCSPQRYWLKMKMEKALDRLKTSMTIGEIATSLGFESRSGFHKAFLREIGRTPSVVRDEFLSSV